MGQEDAALAGGDGDHVAAVRVALYVATIVGTHLTGFMNLVEQRGRARRRACALPGAGYLYFLPLIGREPIRWRVSYPTRIFLLFIAMPVDAFTGLVLGSESSNPFPGLANRPGWAPSPISDVHIGGAVMWVGGAGIMFALVWRCSSPGAGKRAPTAGSAGSSPPAAPIRHAGQLASGRERRQRCPPRPPRPERQRVDDDDEQLAAYNAFLARINKPRER